MFTAGYFSIIKTITLWNYFSEKIRAVTRGENLGTKVSSDGIACSSNPREKENSLLHRALNFLQHEVPFFFTYESHFAPKSRTQGSVYLTSPPKEVGRHQGPVPGNVGSIGFHLSEHRTSTPACLIQLGASWIPRLTHQIRELGSHDLGLLPASQGLKLLEADHLPKTPSQVNASWKGGLYTLDIWSSLLTSHNST